MHFLIETSSRPEEPVKAARALHPQPSSGHNRPERLAENFPAERAEVPALRNANRIPGAGSILAAPRCCPI